MMAIKTMTQIIASALISPPGALIMPDNHTFKKFTGLSLAKNPGLEVIVDRESSFLKISRRNGLKSPSEITENKLERILKLKYAKINLGYFDT